MIITNSNNIIRFRNNKDAVKLFTLQPLKRMLSRESCIGWLINQLHPGGPTCPHCHQKLHDDRIYNFKNLHRVLCVCGKRYSAFTKTILEGAKIAPEDFFLLNVFFAFEMKTKDIVEITGLSRQIIAKWRRKIEIWQNIRYS